jgi:prevent-host-death family protein
MIMLKKISALKARQNLGQLLNEVSIKGDYFIIERAGKPLAALVDLESLQKIQADRDSALAAVRKIWGKLESANAPEVEETIGKAIDAVRKAKKIKSAA